MGIKVLIIGKGLTGLVAAWQLLEQSAAKKLPEQSAARKLPEQSAVRKLPEQSAAQKLPEWLQGRELEIEIISDGSGASPYVHGLNIPLHPDDSVELFKKDTMLGGYGLSEEGLVNILCEESVHIPELLGKLHVGLEKKDGQYQLLKPLGATWPRVAGSGNHTGADIISSLMADLSKRENVKFTYPARMMRLDVEAGKVKGAVLWKKETAQFVYRQADAVLLACGGFCGIYPFSTNAEDSGGDGIAMAYEAGARLLDMEFIQFEPSVALYPKAVRGKGVVTTMFYEGAVLRNAKKERFMLGQEEDHQAECVGKDILARAIYQEIQEGHPTEHGGVYFDATGVGKERLLESYGSYVGRYQKVGMDISEEMFEIAPAPHTSLGGVFIHGDCETDVKGLFAAGEVIGGLHGANRVGGNAGLETLVFGQLAAKGICSYLQTIEEKQETGIDDGEKIHRLLHKEQQEMMDAAKLKEMRAQMERLLQSHLFVLRNGPGLTKAISALDKMLAYVKSHYCKELPYERLRLENDLICALLLAKAAYARTQSVGCHVRTDSTHDSGRYHVMLQKDEKGQEKIWKEYITEGK